MAANTNLKSALEQLEETLEIYLVDKAPFSIPDDWKELIVNFAPYLAILGVVVSILGLLSAFGLTSMAAPFVYWAGFRLGLWYYLMLAQTLVIAVLEGLAVKPLFSRSLKGWKLIYYAVLVSAVYSLITFSLGSLVGVVLSLYILFQVKSYYR